MKHGFYGSWHMMKVRCYCKSYDRYYRYGGRGIRVCEEWQTFKGFADWALQSGWQKGYTIDRIDNDGDYCPENCRWVSRGQNAKNKSTTKLSDADAETIRKRKNESWKELAREYECSYVTIWHIMHNITHVAVGESIKQLRKRGWK